jgi:uncharacterized protein YceK
VISVKRFVIVTIFVFLLSGCRTVVKVNNSTDPKSFDPIEVVAWQNYFFDEITIDVPEEIRDEDFTVTRVDMFADILADTLAYPLDVALYIGLEPGDNGLDDPTINHVITATTLEEVGQRHHVDVKSPAIALQAMQQSEFYIKVVIRTSQPTAARVLVENVYLDIWLERQTEGLFPFFYLF